MIGDWVKTNPSCGKLSCGIKSNIAMVSEISFSNSDGMYVSLAGIKGRYYDDELEPILITPEYLEKKGFVSNCNKEHTYNYYNYENLSISRHFWDDNDHWVVEANAGYESAGLCRINYIHKLQHILKSIQDDVYLMP